MTGRSGQTLANIEQDSDRGHDMSASQAAG